jgi:hypothetical protein
MSKFKAIDLAKSLGVKPEKVFDFLKVSLGDNIKKGDLLAAKKTLLAKKEAYSSVSGVLDRLEEATGRIIIKQVEEDEKHNKDDGLNQEKKEDKEKKQNYNDEKAEDDGREKNKAKVKIKTKGMIKGVFGFGQAKADLIVLDESFCLEELNKKAEGKIVFAPCLDTIGALFKADALDIAGLVLGRLKKSSAKKIEELGNKLDIAFLVLTFSEDKELSLSSFKAKKVWLKGDKKRLEILKD